MPKGIMVTGLLASVLILSNPILCQQVSVLPGDYSRDTYFTVHNLHPAHAITRGAGAKVGILDHGFGMGAHPELYAGEENFQAGPGEEGSRSQSHHGYWMALALREVAPEAEMYALNTYSPHEDQRVEATLDAIDWAIEHHLDAITYSAEAFSPEAQARLDPAVERAIDAGVVVVFTQYPHDGNLLPGWIGPRTSEDDRAPDLNVFQNDCTVEFRDRENGSLMGGGVGAPVTAGFVALLRSLDPTLDPVRIKEVLMASSHPMEMEGRMGLRVPDLGEAVLRVRSTLALKK